MMPQGNSAWRWLTRTVLTVTAAAGLALTGGAQGASAAPAPAPGGWLSLTSGGGHTCALQSGHAWCWGRNTAGQLGNGTTVSSPVPVAVSTSGALAGKTLMQISAGADHTCALTINGRAYCWGDGTAGELGSNTAASSDVPVAVLSSQTFTQISAGAHRTCAIDATASAWCWGQGILGTGSSTSNPDVPQPVAGGKTWTQISAGAYFTCAIQTTTGRAWCWGEGDSGQLGNGSVADSPVPVAVSTSGVLAGKQLTAITGWGADTCALDTAGHAYCWGNDLNGQLGNGADATISDVPAAVLGRHVFTRIAASDALTCALSADHAWCWGQNDRGELGNGTITDDSVIPVPVDRSGVLAGLTLTQIAAGDPFGCAVRQAGAAYCWGGGDAGQLGDGNTTDSEVPVAVHPHA
jgi:alpha-tubulin suppressor-like RCC1 family protein